MTATTPLALSLAALACAAAIAAVTSSEPSRHGGLLEFQSGPVSVSLGAGDALIGVHAERCLRAGCPLLSVRVQTSAAALQPAPGEPRRVQRLEPAALQGGRLPAQGAGEMLGEERSMSEAPRAQPAEDEGR